MRQQSAMEYLMTYGWAILIIAVVLAALFELGVFSNTNLSPRAQPGNCHVFRPDGPGTTSFINTEGVCNGELPEYVASFNGNGQYISANIPNIPTGANSRTVTAWFSDLNPGARLTLFDYGVMTCSNPGVPPEFFQIYIQGDPTINAWCTDQGTGGVVNSGTWYFAAYSYDKASQTQSGYFGYNGKINSASSVTYNSYNTILTPFYIGFDGGGGWFYGSISNVQVYNTSLSPNEIQALYDEGIGGAPLDLQNLLAWYPLNGNGQDYSGNNNNGQINSATFTSQWANGYSSP